MDLDRMQFTNYKNPTRGFLRNLFTSSVVGTRLLFVPDHSLKHDWGQTGFVSELKCSENPDYSEMSYEREHKNRREVV